VPLKLKAGFAYEVAITPIFMECITVPDIYDVCDVPDFDGGEKDVNDLLDELDS
jgi:hypothetical protein